MSWPFAPPVVLDVNYTIPAGYSIPVLRQLSIQKGVRLSVGFDSILRIL